MKHSFLIPLLSFCLLLSCKKEKLPKDTPKCIKKKIEQFGLQCSDSRVVKYSYQGKIVYAFQDGSCIYDGGTGIYDENCNYICTMDGWHSYILCNGDTFSKKAIFMETIRSR